MIREGLVDGWHEVGGQARLDDVSYAARLQCGAHAIQVLMHGQENQLCAAPGLLQAPGCFDAIQTRAW